MKLDWSPVPWEDEPVTEYRAVYRGHVLVVFLRNGQWQWLSEGATPETLRTGTASSRTEAERLAMASVNEQTGSP